MKPLLTEIEVAELTGINVWTLQRWRSEGQRPPVLRWLKIGQQVRYRPEDLEAWLEECEKATELAK